MHNLWTGEKDGYVLVRLQNNPNRPYDIHNKVLNQTVFLKFRDLTQYHQVIQNMIDAGVEIWDKFPDEE